MKILFVSAGSGPDYQCDMLFHGLRSLHGNQVVDVARLSYMYNNDFPDGSELKRQLYGKGFTIYGLLTSDSDVDRDDIKVKIQRRYYDLVIFGSIRRCTTYLLDVLEYYDCRKIVFIDGEDDQLIDNRFVGRGLYFKREMINQFRCGFPIQFGIPLVKIAESRITKKKTNAYVDPRDRATYIFNSEQEYYNDYAESRFGFTMKKAGWDCLRHYEIMANHCIPEFDGLEHCPAWTMVFLPKLELIESRRLLAKHGPAIFEVGEGRARWESLEARISANLKRHLTTEALARYVMATVAHPDQILGTMM